MAWFQQWADLNRNRRPSDDVSSLTAFFNIAPISGMGWFTPPWEAPRRPANLQEQALAWDAQFILQIAPSYVPEYQINVGATFGMLMGNRFG
jgi:hypothetical protein